MPRAKRSIQAAVTIDGFPLVWHLHREQQETSTDGWKGVAIHVKVAEGVRRELFLEYPAAAPKMNGLIADRTGAAKHSRSEGGGAYSAGDGCRMEPGVARKTVHL